MMMISMRLWIIELHRGCLVDSGPCLSDVEADDFLLYCLAENEVRVVEQVVAVKADEPVV